ncbi:hypothetical protein BSNK01_12150 [Bacillaceae bacterium]
MIKEKVTLSDSNHNTVLDQFFFKHCKWQGNLDLQPVGLDRTKRFRIRECEGWGSRVAIAVLDTKTGYCYYDEGSKHTVSAGYIISRILDDETVQVPDQEEAKEEARKAKNLIFPEDKLVVVEELYAPVLGKCVPEFGHFMDASETNVFHTRLKVLNYERKEEVNGVPTRYDIGQARAVIDFEKKVCMLEWYKFWIGGQVDRETLRFRFDWTERIDETGDGLLVRIKPDHV